MKILTSDFVKLSLYVWTWRVTNRKREIKHVTSKPVKLEGHSGKGKDLKLKSNFFGGERGNATGVEHVPQLD